MTGALITAVEITAYDPGIPGTRTLYYSSDRLVTGPSATPAHQWFDDRILSAPNFARRAFGSARVTSGGQSTAGVLELGNVDHALSALLDLGLDGRDIVVRVGTDPDTYPTGWTTWLTGTVRQVEVTAEKATLRLADRMAVLDLPLQATKYAGTNTGSPLSGAEGVATDIKGQPKILAWGRCYQVPAVLVNTAKLTWQVNDGSVHAIDAVYDKGAALTFSGTDHANLAALEAAAIAAGQFDTCKALGVLRLGASPAGRVTADVRGDNSGAGYVDRPGAIMRRILETKCGQSGQIATASFTALDAAANYEAGICIVAESTARAALEQIGASVGASCTPDRLGQWTATQLVAPTGTPAASFTDADFADIEREATNDPGGGIPAWQVTLRYRRHWTQFAAADLVGVGGAMTEALRAELVQEWRTTTATDAATQTLHRLATTLDRDTLLISATDAASERDRLLALHKARRDYVRLTLPLDTASVALDLGQIVQVTTAALGYCAGRTFVVLGTTREDSRIILDLWG